MEYGRAQGTLRSRPCAKIRIPPREVTLTGPERTICVGGYQGEGSVHTQALRTFAAQVERELPGWRVEVTANVADLGHKAADCLAMVADGRLELCYFNSSYLAERVPSLALFDIPFVLTAREVVYRRLGGALGRTLPASLRGGKYHS
jgi:TRAP-type C4-dicarboxylate transport system substrate-binding protein